MEQTPAPQDRSHKPLTAGWALVFVAFGAYLLIGAYVVATSGKWPIFMPAQFDFIGLFLGSWVGGVVLFLVGGYCVWLGGVALWRVF